MQILHDDGTLVIVIDEMYYNVKVTRLDKVKKFNKSDAYVIGEYVYPYNGKLKEDSSDPGIYKDSNGDLKIIEPSNARKKLYHIDNVYSLSLNSIFKNIDENKDNFLQMEDIEVINNNTDIYVPIIKDDDDFLKYLIKRVIIEKKINLKNYKDKFANEYALNNMKSGLNKSTKMTVTNFKIWCEVLGLKWNMSIEDSGEDKLNPLNEEINISSDEF